MRSVANIPFLIGVSIAVVLLAGCMETGEQKPLTVEEVLTLNGSSDGYITVIGTASRGKMACTQVACPPSDQCCNTCSAPIYLGEDHKILLKGNDVGCNGNECTLTCSPLKPEQRYIINGTLDPGSKPILRIYEVRMVNETA